jgi:hypothetical protein
MGTSAVFPRARAGAGMYESFYLRAVDAAAPRGFWIRHTVHKRPGAAAAGSVWCTYFDATAGAPFMHKVSGATPSEPAGGWIAIGGHASMGPGFARGGCGPTRWSLSWRSEERELRHLRPGLLYRAQLPRTKLTSPAPRAEFAGTFALEGRAPLELSHWPGMVGHNWGSEHAERWIWLHGLAFEEAPEAWLDVALGRVRVGGHLTPWLANGALTVAGTRRRIGALRARGLEVQESPGGCRLRLRADGGMSVAAEVAVPDRGAAGWRYADPDGGGHDVVNCSIAALSLELRGRGAGARTLHTAHCAAYELGMREHDHGVPLAPFADG